MRKTINWARLLAFVTGLVNQELLLQNEYLGAENRILRARLPSRLRLSDPERYTLAEIGKRLGRKGLQQVGLHSQAGYHPGVVSAADRTQVRRFQTPRLSWPTPGRTRGGSAGGSLGSRELRLGL